MESPWVHGQFTYDVGENLLYKKDEENYIAAVGAQQLNTIGQLYLLDIFLSENNYVDAHYHANASELTYCISGKAEVSFINPTINEWQSFILQSGEVISIPQGFWHGVKAMENDTHLLAAHDTNNLKTVFGSDILRLTPTSVIANMYNLDERALQNALQPIDETIVIGPPIDSTMQAEEGDELTEEMHTQGENQENMREEMQGTSQDDVTEKMKESSQEQISNEVRTEQQEQNDTKENHYPRFPMQDISDVQSSTDVLEQSNDQHSEQTNQEDKEQRKMHRFNQVLYTCPVCKGRQYRNM